MMRIGIIKGIEIRISILLPLIFLAYYFLDIWLKALLVFLIILAHELGHVFCALKWGITVEAVELFPLGGISRLKDSLHLSLGQELLLYLIGPVINFVLGGAGLLLQSHNFCTGEVWCFLIRASWVIGTFNLLPIWPLDGGRALRAIISPAFGFYRGVRFTSKLGQLWAICFFLGGALAMLKSPVCFYWWILAIYIYHLNSLEKKQAFLNLLSFLTKKNQEIEVKRFLLVKLITAKSEMIIENALKEFSPRRFHLIYLVDEHSDIIGLISEKDVINFALKGQLNRTLGEVIYKNNYL